MNLSSNRELAEGKEAGHPELADELAELRQALEEQTEYLKVLASVVERTSSHEADLRAIKGIGYQQLIRSMREVVHSNLSLDATVIVASGGDDQLLDLYGRRGWHFPQAEDGAYAGYHPAGSTAVIAQLEALRSKGGEFLLFPSTALWWLEHYPEFAWHLESRYRLVASQEDMCLIYDLEEGAHVCSDAEKSGIVRDHYRTTAHASKREAL